MSALPRPATLPDWDAQLRGWETQRRPEAAARFERLCEVREQVLADPDLGWRQGDAEIRARLLALAIAADDLPLVRHLASLRRELGEASLDDELNLATALWRSGHTERGIDVTRRLLLLHPREARAHALHAALLAWQRQDWPLPLPADGWGDDTLLLEPLGHQHCDDFAWAYYDPEIASRCCLPWFESDHHWHTWLDQCRDLGDEMSFGVWHAHWGFVGAVNLVMAADIGFFYYWIAADFQGHGLGPQAVSLLLELAEWQWGMRVCYAKCFVDNHASRRGLAKLGFAPVDLDIRTEQGEELHFRRVSPGHDVHADRGAVAGELRFLFERMRSGSRVIHLAAAPRAGSRPHHPTVTTRA